MRVHVQDQQSLLDLALQTSGSIAAVFALAAKNGLSMTDSLPIDYEIDTVDVVDRIVVARYAVRHIRPATAVSEQDASLAPSGGIGFMRIGVNFKVR